MTLTHVQHGIEWRIEVHPGSKAPDDPAEIMEVEAVALSKADEAREYVDHITNMIVEQSISTSTNNVYIDAQQAVVDRAIEALERR